MKRLEMVEKDLAVKLNIASPGKLRVISTIACQLALEMASVSDAYVSDAFFQLQRDGFLSVESIAKLNDIASNLDDKYFDLQESGSADINDSEMMLFFSQARAISALAFSGGSNVLDSAMESIYEASAAVDNPDELFDKLMMLLN